LCLGPQTLLLQIQFELFSFLGCILGQNSLGVIDGDHVILDFLFLELLLLDVECVDGGGVPSEVGNCGWLSCLLHIVHDSHVVFHIHLRAIMVEQFVSLSVALLFDRIHGLTVL
jgi:hypothetical protein